MIMWKQKEKEALVQLASKRMLKRREKCLAKKLAYIRKNARELY